MNTFPVGMDAAGEKMYWFDSRGRNTSALIEVDIATGEKTELASDPKSDPNGVLTDTVTDVVQAVSFNYLKDEWTALDAEVKPDLDYLSSLSDGELHIGSRSHANAQNAVQRFYSLTKVILMKCPSHQCIRWLFHPAMVLKWSATTLCRFGHAIHRLKTNWLYLPNHCQ